MTARIIMRQIALMVPITILLLMGTQTGTTNSDRFISTKEQASELAMRWTGFDTEGAQESARSTAHVETIEDTLSDSIVPSYSDSVGRVKVWRTTFLDLHLKPRAICSKSRDWVIATDLRTGSFLYARSRSGDDCETGEQPRGESLIHGLACARIKFLGLVDTVPEISLREALSMADFSHPYSSRQTIAFLVRVYAERIEKERTVWCIIGRDTYSFRGLLNADCSPSEHANFLSVVDAETGNYYFAQTVE
jgi:hypothetical protein